MKNSITILAIGLFTLAGIQSAYAQSEEETITWLKDYGIKMLALTYQTGADNEFTVTQTAEWSENNSLIISQSGGKWGDKKFIIEKECLKNMELPNEKFMHYFNDEFGNAYNKSLKLYQGDIRFTNKCATIANSGEASYKHSYIGYFYFKNFKDFQSFHKAIFHLAKLQGAKEKPMVNKDMFDE